MSKKIAVVTGANRGIGFETVRQLAKLDMDVVLTSRNVEAGEMAAQQLRDEGLKVHYHKLDVTAKEDILSLKAYLEQEFGKLHVLVNNAGVLLEGDRIKPSVSPHILDTDLDRIRNTFEINSLGPLRLSLALLPLMQKAAYGRIVNVSSGMGSMGEWGPGYPGYRISKVSLNMITRLLASEVQGENILVNSVCPGWVRTDMGGPNANRSLEQGAYGLVRLATLNDNGPNGRNYRDDKEIPW